MNQTVNQLSYLLQLNLSLFQTENDLFPLVKRLINNYMATPVNKEYQCIFDLGGVSSDQLFEIFWFLINKPIKVPTINLDQPVLFINYGEGFCDADIFNTIHIIMKLCKINQISHYKNLAYNVDILYNEFCQKNMLEKKLECFFIGNKFSDPNLRFYGHDYFYRYKEVNIELKNVTDKKLYTFFNLTPRSHRNTLIALLNDKDLLKYGFVSSPYEFHKEKNYNKNYDWENFTNSLQSLIGNFQTQLKYISIKNLKSLYDMLPLRLDERLSVDNADALAYSDLLYKLRQESLFDLVSETWYTGPQFYSEKTFLPIFLGKPFIMVNSYKALYVLKKFGYKTFHPLIDESYDDISNDTERLLAIVKTLDKLNQLRINDPKEFYKIYEELLLIAEFNKNVFLENKKWSRL